jgi:hypothetical protein
MSDTPTNDEKPEANVQNVGLTADDLAEITCTLTDEEADHRQDWIAENLVPYLDTIEDRSDGYSFVFDRNPEAYAAVAEIAWKESQCCAWATFEIELPPGDGPIKWHERSDSDEGKTLFGVALQEIRWELEGVPAIEKVSVDDISN